MVVQATFWKANVMNCSSWLDNGLSNLGGTRDKRYFLRDVEIQDPSLGALQRFRKQSSSKKNLLKNIV